MTPRQMGYELQNGFNKAFLDNERMGEAIAFGIKLILFLFIAGYVIYAITEIVEKVKELIQRFKND